jgi:hypothetical protein
MTDDELRDLQERVSVIVDMTESAGWLLLTDAAHAVLLHKQARIIQGKCATQEDYRADCAFGDGIQYLLGLPLRLQAQLDQELAERQALEAEAEAEAVGFPE